MSFIWDVHGYSFDLVGANILSHMQSKRFFLLVYCIAYVCDSTCPYHHI